MDSATTTELAIPKTAYLFSRYPIASQTFCDSEMMALESLGAELAIATLNPPKSSFRHERLRHIKAEVLHCPPAQIKKTLKESEDYRKLKALIEEHDRNYRVEQKNEIRALNACAIAVELRKTGVEHIHVHFANRATHTAIFLKELGFSFSFTAHAQDFMVDIIDNNLLGEMCHKAEFVITVSDYSRKALLTLLSNCSPKENDETKIHRIYNGINLGEFSPVPLVAEDGPLQILSVGRLIAFKGFDTLIDACALLQRKLIPFTCRIIGEGPLREELQSQINRLGLEEHVFLLGLQSQNQINNLLHQSNVFALACRIDEQGASDVLPTVITEAMASALPVVSTDLAGVPEMVLHEKTGLLVSSEDPTALADALQLLAENPTLRQALGNTGKEQAEELFDNQRTASQLAQLFTDHRSDLTSQNSSTTDQILYLCGNWDPQKDELAHVAQKNSIRVYALEAAPLPSKKKNQIPTPTSLPSFLPDPSILESYWLAHPELREQCEQLREQLPKAQQGEEFYREARRAVYLTLNVCRQGISHIHAFRSDSALCTWLLSKLTGLTCSMSIGANPILPANCLKKITPHFDLVNVGESSLQDESKGNNTLQLPLSEDKIHRFGPLRLAARSSETTPEKNTRYNAWLSELEGYLS